MICLQEQYCKPQSIWENVEWGYHRRSLASQTGGKLGTMGVGTFS